MGAFAAVSTLFQVGSAVMQGQQQSAQVDAQQAQVESQRTADGVSLANRQEQRQIQLRKTLSSLRASAGARGIDGSDGSTVAVAAGLKADAAREQGYDKSSYDANSVSYQNQSSTLKSTRSNIPVATGVSAASAVASSLLRWNQLGG